MSAQYGPRDTDAVLEARYWLTDKGYEAVRQIEAAQRGAQSKR